MSLNKLGDFLRARGQAGDAERALAAYERATRRGPVSAATAPARRRLSRGGALGHCVAAMTV